MYHRSINHQLSAWLLLACSTFRAVNSWPKISLWSKLSFFRKVESELFMNLDHLCYLDSYTHVWLGYVSKCLAWLFSEIFQYFESNWSVKCHTPGHIIHYFPGESRIKLSKIWSVLGYFSVILSESQKAN